MKQMSVVAAVVVMILFGSFGVTASADPSYLTGNIGPDLSNLLAAWEPVPGLVLAFEAFGDPINSFMFGGASFGLLDRSEIIIGLGGVVIGSGFGPLQFFFAEDKTQGITCVLYLAHAYTPKRINRSRELYVSLYPDNSFVGGGFRAKDVSVEGEIAEYVDIWISFLPLHSLPLVTGIQLNNLEKRYSLYVGSKWMFGGTEVLGKLYLYDFYGRKFSPSLGISGTIVF